MMTLTLIQRRRSDELQKCLGDLGIECIPTPLAEVSGNNVDKERPMVFVSGEKESESFRSQVEQITSKVSPSRLWVCTALESHRPFLEDVKISTVMVPSRWDSSIIAQRIACEANLHQAPPSFHGMIGCGPTMTTFKKRLERIARSPENLLLVGPTGSGKGVTASAFAAAIGKDMVKVNISEIKGDLFEAEVFGSVKGGFTDAVDRDGLLLSAGNGLVFLDEIGELELNVQAKLLTAIEEKTVRPVGSEAFKKIGARFLFATNRNLKEMVEEGTFRKDLYHRIKTLTLEIPPLVEHKEDLLILAHGLLKEHYPHLKLSDTNKDLLFNYDWPGNIRELAAILRRVAVFSEGTLDNLELMEAINPSQSKSQSAGHMDFSKMTYKEAQNWLQKTYFTQLKQLYSVTKEAYLHADISKAQYHNLIKIVD